MNSFILYLVYYRSFLFSYTIDSLKKQRIKIGRDNLLKIVHDDDGNLRWTGPWCWLPKDHCSHQFDCILLLHFTLFGFLLLNCFPF